jgi:dipeptidyl aminopeptidase/acylaminoacyl peptidase
MQTLTQVTSMLAVVLASWPARAPAQQARPLRAEDIVRRERLTSSLSPNGKALLFSRLTPFVRPGPGLFVVELTGGRPRELAREIDPRARIFAWAWSPTGRQIGVAGTIGAETRIWHGDVNSGRLVPVPHRGLRTSPQPGLVWASEDELLLATLPDSSIESFVQAEDVAIRQWAKTNEGLEPSRSILETGAPGAAAARATGFWTLLNVRDGSATSVPDGGTPARTVAAHNGKAIASLFRLSPPRLDVPGLIRESDVTFAFDGFGLTVVKAERGALLVRRVREAVDVLGDGMCWSPDGTKLAFFARRATGGHERRINVYDPGADSLAEMNTDGLTPAPSQTPFTWSSRGSLIVLMSSSGGDGKAPRRPDWWAVRSDAPPRNLTAGIPAEAMQIPFHLVTEPAGSLIGVFGNDLWRLDPDGLPPKKLGMKSELHEVRLEWPLEGTAVSKVVVSTKRGSARILGRVDLAGGELTEIAQPAGESRLCDFHPATGANVFEVQAGREYSLWASASAGEATRLVAEANAHLREVSEPAMKAIQYDDAKGRNLHGWLVLPPGYNPDRRWPLVTLVYPGTVFNEHAKPFFQDEAELIAGHGYVVLLPSMPRPEGAAAHDPYDALAPQVLPAVDKAIELGIADPERLGVMGHSFGGYAVYGLVTQTTRFKAAVASAGSTNLMSQYGQFVTLHARSDFPLDETHHLSWSESEQGNLGSPLWKGIPRYIHNSPINHVGRVETPLLLLHGDLDFVPIAQAEEFYTSLARRGKRARFVRYWGEGHLVLSSSANYLDYWQQVFAWFDELLAKPPK